MFVTGGLTSLPGFAERVGAALRSILPVGTPLQIKRAKDPLLDAWRGAAMIAQDRNYTGLTVTRKEYEEYGGDYIKEHGLGNLFLK